MSGNALKYRPEIDGLRAVAVLAVILYHAEFKVFRGGFLGVDVFFVISGYLITSIILRELQTGSFRLSNFYERRARRILPALLTVMLCSIPAAWVLLVPHRFEAYGRSLLAALGFYANFYFWSEADYFDVAATQKPFLHTWSLSVEEQFYLVFPFAVILIWKYARAWLVPVFCILLLLSLLMAHATSSTYPEASFYLLHTRMWELLSGAIVTQMKLSKLSRFGTVVAPAAGLALITFAVVTFDHDTPHPSLWTVAPVAGTVLLVACCAPADPVTRLLSNKHLVRVGRLSYSLYLWHVPIFVFARTADRMQTFWEKISLIGLSLALSMITYRFVETPLRSREAVGQGRFLVSTVAATCSLAVFAGWSLVSNGVAHRFDPADLEMIQLDHDVLEQYVWERHRLAASPGPFPDKEGLKVLVIGDSYAGDFLNVLYESGLAEGLNLRSLIIRSGCGNLYLDYDISQIRSRTDCKEAASYENPDYILTIAEADVIVLASSWRDWEAELLPESLENLRAVSQARILVLGRKHFGEPNFLAWVHVPNEKRLLLRNPLPEWHSTVNALMKSTVGADEFIDLDELVSGGSGTAPVFNGEGRLLSFDGAHVTTAGAIFLGTKLREHPLLVSAFSATTADSADISWKRSPEQVPGLAAR